MTALPGESPEAAYIGTEHLIAAGLIERIEGKTGDKVHIRFKISRKQFTGQESA